MNKSCTKCKVLKLLVDFSSDNRRNRKSLKSWCKTCCAEHVAINKKRHAEYAKNTRKKYKEEWREFFDSVYSEHPSCSICEKTLEWSSGRVSGSVAFDHRIGNESIKENPASFWQSRACTEINQKIWTECNFGILCSSCNSCLPTLDRSEWLRKALEYHEQT